MRLSVNNVTKRYRTVTAVDAISLDIQPGKIQALLGPNGAGKSSLVRMLVGLTQPDEGEILVENNGESIELTYHDFAYLPEDRGLYQDRTILDNLNYIASLRGLKLSDIRSDIDNWLERFELTDRKDEPLRQMSKGNQQKVQLIATLLHDPQLVILDEPFSGLDPVNQEHVLTVLNELRERGKTVVLSAHQMELVERLADTMLLMNKGRAVAQGSLQEIRNTLLPKPVYRVTTNAQLALDSWQGVEQIESIRKVSEEQVEITFRTDAGIDELWPQLAQQVSIKAFAPIQPGLHDLYLDTIRRQASDERSSEEAQS
ncbi:ATP-binding cassette domain-containing protein [Idiomarina loihiensis]|uniref:ABC transporter ATP-binding protein n=1 Tax=Idiomarina TaxID=135575 RepID=UPI000C0D36AE|nr:MULTISPECIES: ATP-binding cassette domain-containing protein [Idiomarina]MRJ44575.1 ATP-binding cassette domain-containing protein [Idiomarina loihiensis]PHQ88731.1 MAG: Na+ ABC transporter ATP-binding protein [Idiomarina sp.]PWW40547.1 ABC-2 type transport system ATP-binding protein [Idiomarina loihiensis]TDP50238.1 ABC-2 type transport system ATP-binding protein [Idiomarina loihiensis]TDS24410.1 ABC-2 type transport system ATP-binding protein [Idiomarina sp. H2]